MGNTGSSERATRDIGHPAHDRRGKYPPDYPWSGSGGGRNAGDSYSSDYDAPPVAYPAYHPPPEGYPPLGYPAAPENTRPQRRPTPPRAPPAPSSAAAKRPKLLGRFSRIGDDFTSLDQITEALSQSGLESSNLIIGIDFTKSNEWTGKHSFNGRSLHDIRTTPNPYEKAISIVGRTLSSFDEDNLIPCFGFGDASTHDQDVFSFNPGDRPCNGLEEVLERYREIVPHLRLSGPTSFAPIIEMAMTIVEKSGGQYHVLLIIADGQVTRSVDTGVGRLSPQEQKTVDAIVKASEFPLSIILVGVGDGPWDTMKEFDDYIPNRSFDNFQFVNYTEIMMKNISESRKETEFALAALMEIPLQYKATLELGMISGSRVASSPKRNPRPPPIGSSGGGSFGSKVFGSTAVRENATSYSDYKAAHIRAAPATAAPAVGASSEPQVCPVCLSNPKNMAFGCGHLTCLECGPNLQSCPLCRSPIETRIKLY